MRVATVAFIMALIAAPAAQIERTIARQVRAIVPADGAGNRTAFDADHVRGGGPS